MKVSENILKTSWLTSEVIADIFLFSLVCFTEKRHPFGSDFDSSYVSIGLLPIPNIGTWLEDLSSCSCKIRANTGTLIPECQFHLLYE